MLLEFDLDMLNPDMVHVHGVMYDLGVLLA